MEIKMQKESIAPLGVLVIAALTIQTAAAESVTRQLRDAFDSAPEAVGRKSCDVIWCYEK
jgi:hypothetical protein